MLHRLNVAVMLLAFCTPITAAEPAAQPAERTERPALLPAGAILLAQASSYQKVRDGVCDLADAGYAGAGAMARAFADNTVFSVVPKDVADVSRPAAGILVDPVKYPEGPVVLIVPVTGFDKLVEGLTALHGAPAAKGDGFAEFDVVQGGAADDKKTRVQDGGNGYAVIAEGGAAAELAALGVGALTAAGGKPGADGHDLRVWLDLAHLVKLYEKQIAAGLDEARKDMKAEAERLTAGAGPGGKCTERLKSLAFSCEVYAEMNDGAHPASPEQLAEEALSAPDCTSCPADGKGYRLVSGLKTDDPADYILAFDPDKAHDGEKLRSVTLGGDVKELTVEELRKQLAAQEEALKLAERVMKTVAFPDLPAAAAGAPRTMEELGQKWEPALAKCMGNAADPMMDFAAAAIREFSSVELAVDFGADGLTLMLGLCPAPGSRLEKIAAGMAPPENAAALAALLPADRPVVVAVEGAVSPAAAELMSELCDKGTAILQPLLSETACRALTESLKAMVTELRGAARGQFSRGETGQLDIAALRCRDAAVMHGAISAAIKTWNGTELARDLAACGLAVELKEKHREREGAVWDRLTCHMDAAKMFAGGDEALGGAATRTAERAMQRTMEMYFGGPEMSVEVVRAGDLLVTAVGRDSVGEVEALLARRGAPPADGGPLAARLSAAPAGWQTVGDVYVLELTRAIFARQLTQMRMMREMMETTGAEETDAPDEEGAKPITKDENIEVIEIGCGLPKVEDKNPVHVAVANRGGTIETRVEISRTTVSEVSAFGQQAFAVVMQEIMGGLGGGLPPDMGGIDEGGIPGDDDDLEGMDELDELLAPPAPGLVPE